VLVGEALINALAYWPPRPGRIAGQIFPMCCNSAREEVLSLTWISGRWWSYEPVLLGFFSWHAAPENDRLKMYLRKQDRRKMKDGVIFEKARRLQYGKKQIEKSLLNKRGSENL